MDGLHGVPVRCERDAARAALRPRAIVRFERIHMVHLYIWMHTRCMCQTEFRSDPLDTEHAHVWQRISRDLTKR